MRYIKTYEIYNDMITEKITYKDILLYFSLLYIGSHGYLFYKDIKNMKEISKVYKVVNASDNYPSGKEKQLIDSVRYQIVNQVKNSDLFKKFGQNREYIIDSLETATIKFIEPTGKLVFKDDHIAMFIKLGELENVVRDRFKDNLLYKYFDLQSAKKNVILISKEHINDEDLDEILIHEIYHYVDRLLGDNKDISETLGLSKYVDAGIIDNKDYLNFKASLMYNYKNKNEYLDKLLSDIAEYTVTNFDYLSSDDEIFARWKAFKSKLVKYGYIDKLEDSIDTYDISKYIKDKKVNLTDLDILLIIDWDKMEELDNLIK